MNELDLLRQNSEEQCRLIEVQQQKSHEADKALNDYLEAQARQILEELFERFGYQFIDTMEYEAQTYRKELRAKGH